MSSFLSGDLIKDLRARKRWQQRMLMAHNELSGMSGTTLSRVENARQNPYAYTLGSAMDHMKMPVDTFFCPFLEEQTLEMCKQRAQLLYALDLASCFPHAKHAAVDLLRALQDGGDFSTGVNRQFVLSCQTRLSLLDGEPPRRIIDAAREGIALTYPEFDPDTFEGDMLLFDEPQLIHTLALAHARDGSREDAICLLERAQAGLSRLPRDDRTKETHLAPMLLDLAQLLAAAGRTARAVHHCEAGNLASLKRNKGKHTPDFVFLKARLLKDTDLLLPVYFGYTLLGKAEQARQVMEYARKRGREIETYGVEHLPAHIPDMTIDRGRPVPCDSFGALIKGLRKEAGLNQQTLCEGICNISTLSRIENSKERIPVGNVYYLEAFMQRMGRNIDYYFNTFLGHSEFAEKQMRDEINSLFVNRRYDEGERLLDKLAGKKDYQTGVNLQFIKLAKAELHDERQGSDAIHMKMLMEAWRVTRRKLDEDAVAYMRLTNTEITLLNQVALHLCETGERPRGVKLLENLLDNVGRFYVDESERIRTYIMVMYNCSKHIGLLGQWARALHLATRGYDLALKHNHMRLLPSFAYNIGCDLYELGEKEKSRPYFALAYYGSALIGNCQSSKPEEGR